MNDIPEISIPSYGGSTLKNAGQFVTVGGLTVDESERLRASLGTGHYWVRRGKDGRLECVPSYTELPGPVADEEMLPFWRRSSEAETSQADMFGFDEVTEANLKHNSPSIYITSLCAYEYSPENYRAEAMKLSEWGFVCLRSQRNLDSGRYWEVWRLLGVWAAKGLLKDVVIESKLKSEDEKFKFALEFIRRNVMFGSLDVSMQRIAMVIDD